MPLAAEETKNPKRDLPRGLIGAIVVLTSFALLILVIAPGGAGTYALIKSGNPLVEALALSYGRFHVDGQLRQPGRPGRFDRELFLDYLCLFAADLCLVPCRLPAAQIVRDQQEQGASIGTGNPRDYRLWPVADRPG